jgi:predicted dinucleotide-binding enzyme
MVLAVAGTAAVDALSHVRAETLAGMTVVDVTNPLDFSGGMPPSLSVCNTDSLAEQLQRSFPQVHIVKTLNTVTAPIMVNPDAVGGGDHTMFLAGDDEAAKAEVLAVLTALGWRDVVDLGDITAARGMEMYLPLWLRMFGTLGSPMFSIKVVR